MDIIDKLRIEANREPHEPVWREAIDEILILRQKFEANKQAALRADDQADEAGAGETMKVRIKRGALVAQDFMVGNWPYTRASDAVDPDMEFDAEWKGKFWDCCAYGYGRICKGVSNGYGNGSIFAFRKDGVEVLQDG